MLVEGEGRVLRLQLASNEQDVHASGADLVYRLVMKVAHLWRGWKRILQATVCAAGSAFRSADAGLAQI